MKVTFRVGQQVYYRTPRGAQEGLGTVVSIAPSSRGVWYVVKDNATGAQVRLRAAVMEAL